MTEHKKLSYSHWTKPKVGWWRSPITNRDFKTFGVHVTSVAQIRTFGSQEVFKNDRAVYCVQESNCFHPFWLEEDGVGGVGWQKWFYCCHWRKARSKCRHFIYIRPYFIICENRNANSIFYMNLHCLEVVYARCKIKYRKRDNDSQRKQNWRIPIPRTSNRHQRSHKRCRPRQDESSIHLAWHKVFAQVGLPEPGLYVAGLKLACLTCGLYVQDDDM